MTVADVPSTNALDEDNLGAVPPSKPSELRAMPDEELFRFYRKLAFSNRYPFDRMVELELTMRLIMALESFKGAADRSARTLNVLTFVLVVLTIVLIVLTVRA
jgi:hypothetical protein